MDSVRSMTTLGLALAMVAVGACAPQTDPVEDVESAVFDSWTADDTSCTEVALTTRGSADGKVILLQDKPSGCGFYGSTSAAPYGASGCNGYVVGFLGTSNLPRPGETLRVSGALAPKASLIIGPTDCQALNVRTHAYIHTTNGSWSKYGRGHNYYGSWNGLFCDMVVGADNGEIPPFPTTSDRDRIRVVVSATVGDAQRMVSAGVRMGTCTPSPQPTGALCDADDECKSGFCAAGSCCGSGAAEKKVCALKELVQSL